jgi:hypothetical protein
MARVTANPPSIGAPPGALLELEPFSAGGGGGAWAKLIWANEMNPRRINENMRGFRDFFMMCCIEFFKIFFF